MENREQERAARTLRRVCAELRELGTYTLKGHPDELAIKANLRTEANRLSPDIGKPLGTVESLVQLTEQLKGVSLETIIELNDEDEMVARELAAELMRLGFEATSLLPLWASGLQPASVKVDSDSGHRHFRGD